MKVKPIKVTCSKGCSHDHREYCECKCHQREKEILRELLV